MRSHWRRDLTNLWKLLCQLFKTQEFILFSLMRCLILIILYPERYKWRISQKCSTKLSSEKTSCEAKSEYLLWGADEGLEVWKWGLQHMCGDVLERDMTKSRTLHILHCTFSSGDHSTQGIWVPWVTALEKIFSTLSPASS